MRPSVSIGLLAAIGSFTAAACFLPSYEVTAGSGGGSSIAGPGGGGATSSTSTSSSSSGASCSAPCAPANECQTASCVDGECVFDNVAKGTPAGGQVAGDCQKKQCDGAGNVEQVADDTDVPDDGKECTKDLCQGGAPSTTPVMVGTACTQNGGKTCNAAGDCVECVSTGDCTSGVCQSFMCVPAGCADGTKNGGESDVDCGGTSACARCADGHACSNGGDCTGGVCTAAMKCCTPDAMSVTCAGKCGILVNNCGQQVTCPGCTSPEVCGGSTPNVCAMPTTQWVNAFYGGRVRLGRAVIDTSNAAYVSGSFSGKVDFGAGPVMAPTYDAAFLTKLGTDGNVLWSRTFGGSGGAYWRDVVLDGSGKPIAVGTFRGSVDFGMGTLTASGSLDDIVVAKYDTSGNAVWTKRYGDAPSQTAEAAAIDAGGNLFVGGALAGSVDFGGGAVATGTDTVNNDALVVKLDAAGVGLWAKSFGTQGSGEVARALALDPVGGAIYVAGGYGGTTNVGGAVLPTPPANQTGLFVLKLDSSGNHVWSRGFTSSLSSVSLGRLALDGAGNVVAVGYARGDVDFGGGPRQCTPAGSVYGAFILKLDSAGNHVFSVCFPASDIAEATDVTIDPSGNILVAGRIRGMVDFGGGPVTSATTTVFSALLLELTSAGAFSGVRVYHSGVSTGVKLYPSSSQALFVGEFGVDYSATTIDFGTTTLSSSGNVNLFLAKVTLP